MTYRVRLVLLAIAGLAFGALAGSLPPPWPFIFIGGLLVATIGLLVHLQRQLKRSRQELARFIELLDRADW